MIKKQMSDVFGNGGNAVPASFGLAGGTILASGTANHDFYHLSFIKDTTITSISLAPEWSGVSNLSGAIIPAGTSLPLLGSSITTSDGLVFVFARSKDR